MAWLRLVNRGWQTATQLQQITHLVLTRLVLAFSLPVIDMVAGGVWSELRSVAAQMLAKCKLWPQQWRLAPWKFN